MLRQACLPARQAQHDMALSSVSHDSTFLVKIIFYFCCMPALKQYTVYILKCSDGSYYTGVTNDIDRRLKEHEQGLNKGYTHNRRPVILVFTEHFQDVNHAISFEKQVKGWRRVKKEALINGRWDLLPELSKTAKNN